ncbi:L-2-amino-thiazoline-4-carboxylic acid hydrolase [Rubrobacter calidifluminis]|uniref:L-2-amino-thiazoline-4-carboxylic acid hydrolase n=1 Tax=Rubrobacter calidifluminis TaxID=1392640 RepID=UPI00235FD191|nr:L-2-amino-thiazoline-4-carboxylic acid hydrolase [Rubrobacter calidifluminis]
MVRSLQAKEGFGSISMKWLKVYGLPRLPLFLARIAMRLGLPGPSWYKWKAASSGTGVILDEMIRAADDLGYNGQKIAQLAMSRIGEKQGRDLREQLGVRTMKDTVDVVMLANRFFDIEITLTEQKEGQYVINADRCPWFGGMGKEGVPGWDVKPCAAFSTYEKALVKAINPNVKLSYTEKRTTGGQTCRGVYQYRDEALGDGPAGGVKPEMVRIGRKPEKREKAPAE